MEATTGDGKKTSDESVALFYPAAGAKIELILPSKMIGAGKDLWSSKTGATIRVYEPWVFVPKETRAWYGMPGMGQVSDLVVATELIEVETAAATTSATRTATRTATRNRAV
jgi:hypothetical protein